MTCVTWKDLVLSGNSNGKEKKPKDYRGVLCWNFFQTNSSLGQLAILVPNVIGPQNSRSALRLFKKIVQWKKQRGKSKL